MHAKYKANQMGCDGPLQNWGKNFTKNSKMAIIIDRKNLWE
jgi:hypothetical protein